MAIGDYTGIHFDINASGNTEAYGIAYDGTYFWITDYITKKVFKYDYSGTYISFFSTGIGNGNISPIGIVWDGTYLWMTTTLNKFYKYDISGNYTGTNFDLSAFTLGTAQAVTFDGTYFYISAPTLESKVHKYDTSGNYISSFNLTNSPSEGASITWDGTSFWIGDNSKIYQYSSLGIYTGFNFNASANNSPSDNVWDGNFFWILDNSVDEVYKYIGTSGTFPPFFPIANFTASPTSGNRPLGVSFTDLSTNSPTSWLWDFKNDGTAISTQQNPSYAYTSAGIYTVKLTATNTIGSDSEIKIDYITVSGTVNSTVFFVGSDSSGDIKLINAGTSDNSIPIYYELETQELDMGDRFHNKTIQDKIVLLSELASGSEVQIKQNEGDYKVLPVDMDSTVSISDPSKFKFNYMTLKWLGNTVNKSPVFEGVYIEKVIDEGII